MRPETNPKIQALMKVLEPYGAERIYLFGSWASGDADDLSDVDIVLIKRTRAAFFSRLRHVARLLPPALGAVDFFVYTPEEFEGMVRQGNAFAEMIVSEGVLIHGNPTD